MTLIELFFRSIFQDNLPLFFSLGLFSFYFSTHELKKTLKVGLFIGLLLVLTSFINSLLFHYVFAPSALEWAGIPELDIQFLSFALYIIVIFGVFHLIYWIMRKKFDGLALLLKDYEKVIPLCSALLGAALITSERAYPILESSVWALGTAIAWIVVLMIFSALKEKLKYSSIPSGLQGGGIFFVILGLISLVFLGYSKLFFA